MLDMMNIINLTASCGFDILAEIMRKYDPIEIVNVCSELFEVAPEELASATIGFYTERKAACIYYLALKELKEHIEDYEQVYERLRDDYSRHVFTRLMLYRFCPDLHFIKAAADTQTPQYFDKSIIRTDENEVYVDCGGFTGDSVLSYMEHCGAYKRIYVYEPDTYNFGICRKNLHDHENIVINHAGVGAESAELALLSASSSSSFFLASADNTNHIKVVALDEDITEPVTFIKMDVEGFEIEALKGARRHIIEDKPKLAICLYHMLSDMWEVPQLIHSINPDYDFYIRHYCAEKHTETVLYAIPK